MQTMDQIALKNGYFLGIERIESRARLVIFEGNVEKVCRKESVKKLKDFVQSGENQLFKGRLQLHKNPAGISVLVKGEIVGEICGEDMLGMMGN